MMDETIMLIRESKRHPWFWVRAIGTLGIWLLWWRNNYLALTRRSIVRRNGVFVKNERAVPLNQVQDISIAYGFIRRMFGLGDIRIETAGSSGTEIIMHDVDSPDTFRSRVFEAIDAFYDEGPAPAKNR
ncbi:MAG: PH domain-containing protein [Chloroflexota bacterium]|jgi:uncharacterized membrane protein YdbT with pleckstrin-like domain|nr:PH domain-containing protein [Anaerolineae bacterium]HMM27873.1 PH domain-containing protein [Aggregatilineaceae bacterium]